MAFLWTTQLLCPYCDPVATEGRECLRHCAESEDGAHRPDLDTLAIRHVGNDPLVIIDCGGCGLSTSITLDYDAIDWE